MIGVDTNVVLRLILADDAPQQSGARRLIDEADAAGTPIVIDTIVLVEIAWVARSTYRLTRERVAALLGDLMAGDHVVFTEQDMVVEALDLYRSSSADLADCLIAVRNRRAGCATTWTFDRRAGVLPGMTLLEFP